MQKIILSVITLAALSHSQQIEKRFFGAISLPIGGEIGYLNETEILAIDELVVFLKASLFWAPVFDNEKVNSVFMVSAQPGLRVKVLENKLMASGGFSVNPMLPVPVDGMDFGTGAFYGLSLAVQKVEIGIYSTHILGQNMLFGQLHWLSLTVSKSFNCKT
jgi:hypothetical protein